MGCGMDPFIIIIIIIIVVVVIIIIIIVTITPSLNFLHATNTPSYKYVFYHWRRHPSPPTPQFFFSEPLYW